MRSASYQVLFLGVRDGRVPRLQDAILKRISDLGLAISAIQFLDEATAATRDRRLPAIALFLGGPSAATDSTVVDDLLQESIVIVPIVSTVIYVNQELPAQLRHINAVPLPMNGGAVDRIASLVLETFRLLRRERKLFVSYRRVESQPLAERLYDALDEKGFDVFIDVRSVPPAADFQSELWHRMSDSDVVVLIDTPGFRESRWTAAELARANATNIQILHLLWPGQHEDASSSFSHFLKLRRWDFWSWWPLRGTWIKEKAIQRICQEAERLRARAIAARHRYLVDNVCDAARDLRLDVALQPERWILIERAGKSPLAIVPAVGVPTSDQINAIFNAVAPIAKSPEDCWVIYDNRGILEQWLTHLDWLDQHLPIRAIRVSAVPDALKALTP